MNAKTMVLAAALCVVGVGSASAQALGPGGPSVAQKTTTVSSLQQNQVNLVSHVSIPTITNIIQQTLQARGELRTADDLGNGLELNHRGMAAAADGEWPMQVWVDANGGTSHNSLATGGYNLNSVGSQLGFQVEITPTVLIGVSGSWQDTRGGLAGGFSSKSTAFGVSPYAGWQFSEHWNVSLTAGENWGDTKLNNSARRYTGKYQTSQWNVQSGLNGSYVVDRVRLAPMLSMLYSQQDSRAFIDSTGARVPGNRGYLARGTVGGSVSLPLTGWEPYIRGGFEHDFTSATPNGDSGGIVGVGTTVTITDAVWLSFDAGYNSIGRTGLSLWSADARANVRF